MIKPKVGDTIILHNTHYFCFFGRVISVDREGIFVNFPKDNHTYRYNMKDLIYPYKDTRFILSPTPLQLLLLGLNNV